MELQGEAILILPDQLPENSKGGLAIPKTAKQLPNTGKVVKVGPACEEVHTGDRVHYARKSASIIEIEGVEHHIIYESKIFYFE